MDFETRQTGASAQNVQRIDAKKFKLLNKTVLTFETSSFVNTVPAQSDLPIALSKDDSAKHSLSSSPQDKEGHTFHGQALIADSSSIDDVQYPPPPRYDEGLTSHEKPSQNLISDEVYSQSSHADPIQSEQFLRRRTRRQANLESEPTLDQSATTLARSDQPWAFHGNVTLDDWSKFDQHPELLTTHCSNRNCLTCSWFQTRRSTARQNLQRPTITIDMDNQSVSIDSQIVPHYLDDLD